MNMKIKSLRFVVLIVICLLISLSLGFGLFACYYLEQKSTQTESEPPKEFCGWSTGGECSNDSDCIKGGCSGQVCQSKYEKGIITTCEWKDCYDEEAYGLKCKCINGKCQWSE